MFVSANFLAIQFGVNDTIAKFFVDREPPKNNLYWKDKLLYLRQAPGYLFLPIIVDTLHRLGFDKTVLLSNEYIDLLEQIGHIAALQEAEKITTEQAVEQCIQLTKDKATNQYFYQALINYMQDGNDNFISPLCTPFKALHRGDLFLFSLSVLHFEDELAEKIIEFWFAIISSFLLLDDADDVEADQQNNDENAFLESGLTKEGIEKIKLLLSKNLNLLKTLNPTLARGIDVQFIKMAQLPNIKEYLNY